MIGAVAGAMSCTQTDFRIDVRTASPDLGAIRLRFALGSVGCWFLQILFEREKIQRKWISSFPEMWFEIQVRRYSSGLRSFTLDGLKCLVKPLRSRQIHCPGATEVTALKVSSLDFKRKVIQITGALDYTTRKESTPKSANSAAPLHMSELLEQHLRNWVEKHLQPNPDGYLFINSKGRPYLSDNIVKYGIHKTMAKLGIERPQGGVHVGIHCFRHGVTTELLEAGTPIHLVTHMMRHGDSQVTLNHYAHVLPGAERAASEKFSQRIGLQLESDPELESVPTAKPA
jgi:integrase